MISSTSSGPKDAQRELATEHCSLPEAGQTQSMKRGVEKEAEKIPEKKVNTLART